MSELVPPNQLRIGIFAAILVFIVALTLGRLVDSPAQPRVVGGEVVPAAAVEGAPVPAVRTVVPGTALLGLPKPKPRPKPKPKPKSKPEGLAPPAVAPLITTTTTPAQTQPVQPVQPAPQPQQQAPAPAPQPAPRPAPKPQPKPQPKAPSGSFDDSG